MTEQEQLTHLCERLGAPAAQATVMAAQLLKRADQLALERKSSRETELKRLLELLTKGHAGEVPKDFVPPPPRAVE
jgi:hypothetical protein